MEMDVDDEDEDWNGCADVHVVGKSVIARGGMDWSGGGGSDIHYQ